MSNEAQQTAEQIWDQLDAEEAGAPVVPADEVLPETVAGGAAVDTVEGVTGADSIPVDDDPMAKITELNTAILGLQAQLEKSNKRLQNAEGRIGGLNRQLLEAKAAPPTPVAPTAEQIAKASPEELAQYERDYPDLVKAMKSVVAAELDSRAPTPAQEMKLPDNLVTREDIDIFRNKMTVEMKHPGWESTVRTPKFHGWLAQQAREVQMLAGSPDPADAIRLLDLHVESSKPAPKPTNTSISSAAALPSGRGGHRVTQKSIDDMTPEEYWKYLDQQDAQAARSQR